LAAINKDMNASIYIRLILNYNVHDCAIIICSLYCFSSQLESQISNSAALETAVSTYFELCGVCSCLEKSFCSNLKKFALSLKNHWGDRLRETLSKYATCTCIYCITINRLRVHVHVSEYYGIGTEIQSWFTKILKILLQTVHFSC
jgi:hypothetical protein